MGSTSLLQRENERCQSIKESSWLNHLENLNPALNPIEDSKMAHEVVYMKDQPWHNKKLKALTEELVELVNEDADKILDEAAKMATELLTTGSVKVEISNDTPAEVVKTPAKKKTRRTKLQMKAAKDKDVQTSD